MRVCVCVCVGGVDGCVCVGGGGGDFYAKYVSCSIKLYLLFGGFVFVCTSQCVLVLLFYICIAFYGHL